MTWNALYRPLINLYLSVMCIPYPPLESALLDSLLLPMAMPNLLKSITTCFVLVVAALLIPLELRPKDSKMSETDTLARQ